MRDERVHRATSDDGTEIAGRVHGHGPPLVLVHGGVGDGETSWQFLLPLLAERFTCFAMSLRGRGLSGHHTDQSPQRLEQDVIAFADSIGGPVGLVGHSSGAAFALGAAARAAQVSAVAAYEPALPELATAEMLARWTDAFARSRRAASAGRLVDAARILVEDVALANDEELVAVAESGRADVLARNVAVHLREADAYSTYRVLDAPRLERLGMPILVLNGSRTHTSYRSIARDLVDRLPDAHVREIRGAGHLGPQLAPARVADELTRFFTAIHRPEPDRDGVVAGE